MTGLALLAAAQPHATHSLGGGLLFILGLVIGVPLGYHRGRLRGLRHLGSAELAARWRTVRGISKY
jgi:hypothetical protein